MTKRLDSPLRVVGYELHDGDCWCIECAVVEEPMAFSVISAASRSVEEVHEGDESPVPLYCDKCDRWLATDPTMLDDDWREHRLNRRRGRSVHPTLTVTGRDEFGALVFTDQHGLTWTEYVDPDDPGMCWCCLWPLLAEGFAPTDDRDTGGEFVRRLHGPGRKVRGVMVADNLSNVASLCGQCVDLTP